MQITRRATMLGIAASSIIPKNLPFSKVTVVEARKIVTMAPGLPTARYIAMADGMILGLGNSEQALAPWTHGRTVTTDRQFADKVLFPGLIDPHIHPMQASVMLNIPFLAPEDWNLPTGFWPGAQNQADYRALLQKMANESTKEVTIIWGHHELFHGPLDRRDLDKIAPDRPLLVWQRSFHDIYANTAALRWMKLDSAESFSAALAAGKAKPEHGNFEKGIFSETALSVALAKLQPVLLAPRQLMTGFGHLQAMMKSRGVTTTSDLATGIFASYDQEQDLIAGAFGNDAARARVNLMPIAAAMDEVEDLTAWYDARRARLNHPNVFLKPRIKLFADGAFFAQNMRIGKPGYTDGHEGKWLTEPDVLAKQLKRYWDAGLSLHIHVNGDEGADVVLDALATLPPRGGQDIVLEHLGYCTHAQIERIARMGLMVSAQPNYIRVLGGAYSRSGLGSDRASLMNRLGSLERGNVPLGLHSDFNMAPIDPFYLAWIAQTREGIDGTVRAPDEQVSRAKALRAITIEAAQVIGMDSEIGSLAAGKKADFIALEDDPFEVETAAIKDLPIAATVFEGRV